MIFFVRQESSRRACAKPRQSPAAQHSTRQAPIQNAFRQPARFHQRFQVNAGCDAKLGTEQRQFFSRDIMENADFAFIPRGDALFSYRLLEAMSFGCIPIILSDNWILPFDRLIDWASLSLRPREDEILPCITLLNRLTDREVLERKKKVLATYQHYFSSLEKIISNGLFAELKKCIA